MNQINRISNIAEQQRIQDEILSNVHSANSMPANLLQYVIEDLMKGILILTEQKELIYINKHANILISKLNQSQSQTNSLPDEIWHVCQALIDSGNLFPNQLWQISSEVVTDNSSAFHLKVQWLRLDPTENPLLLLIIEDRHQSSRKMMIEDAQKYGLTPREMEVWLLHQANYTYKQIATELDITPNTVKKHMKSIHVKRKVALEMKK
ncbi:MAG: LuxR C-terminal-related transcriptional regulator [Coleofasciculaceae cyanobacterium]